MSDKFLGQVANVERMRNSAIKLFGSTISVSFSDEFSQVEQCARKRPANLGAAQNVNSRSAKSLKKMENISENSCSSGKSEASLKPVSTAVKSEDRTPPRPENPAACPRCQSVETKFCYFNNYKVNQPRHFCRNCRRYWTVGGTMRNLPRGKDRRKSKHLPEFQLQNTSKFADLHVKKESVHQTLIFGAGLETKKSTCLEEMDGAKSSGLVTPLPVAVNFGWTLPCNGVYNFVGSGFENYRNKY